MKKLTVYVVVIALLCCLMPAGHADYDPHIDYLELMVRAASCGDIEAGTAAEKCRNMNLAERGLLGEAISFEDLFLLAKIIYAEAGSVYISDDWRMCVGEVVLNRVASPEFPDTIAEVIFEAGQYPKTNTDRFRYELDPSRECVQVALNLLKGDRMLEPWVVFAANFPQGGTTYARYYDKHVGYCFFCTSKNPSLYY